MRGGDVVGARPRRKSGASARRANAACRLRADRTGREILAAANEIAQNAVDQIGERRALRVEPRGAHGEIDGGVIGHVEKQDLRGARDQDPFQHARNCAAGLFRPTG